jgi:nucleoside-diphosphate-sugar epimerase
MDCNKPSRYTLHHELSLDLLFSYSTGSLAHTCHSTATAQDRLFIGRSFYYFYGLMNILITGVTGFAGTNLVRHFSGQNGFRIFGHTRDLSRALGMFPSGQVTLVPEVSSVVMDQQKIDAVIHLAGIAHDLSNQYKSEDYYRVNDLNTRQVYDAFRSSAATRFVYVSSIKAVADVASSPVSEDATPVPSTDYGKSKLQAEQYIRSTLSGQGKRFFILRPCMIHGPGNKGNLNLLYNYVKKGLPFPLGSVRNQRSFLNVENFNFIIEQLLVEDITPGVYHLADTGFLSTAELVRLIGVAMHRHVRIWNIPLPLIRLMFTAIGKKRMLTKLSEDMMVSNAKLQAQLKRPLPVTLQQGIINTIQSFHGF